MRIVGGALKGRALQGPVSQATRPTSDRLRESLFNILAHNHDVLEGAHVLDVFAGTGALACEALSRGAASAVLFETDLAAATVIAANLAALKLKDRATLLRRDATKPGAPPARDRFTLVFCDPPYGKGLAEKALAALVREGWLAEGALCIIEERADVTLALPDGFRIVDTRKTGDSQIAFALFSPPPEQTLDIG